MTVSVTITGFVGTSPRPSRLIWYNSPQWASSVLENNSPCWLKPVKGGQNVGFPKREPQKVRVTEASRPAQWLWRSDRGWQASTMTMMTWEVLLHFGQHFDFQWHLSYTHEHITLLPWPEHISDLKIFQIIQECTPTSFQKWGAYTYEMCHYCSKTGASAWPEFIN